MPPWMRASSAGCPAGRSSRWARWARFSHGSEDYALAFSTSWLRAVPDGSLDPLFIAVREAVEEAILNSLFMAETTTGYRGRVRHAVPIPHIVRSLRL